MRRRKPMYILTVRDERGEFVLNLPSLPVYKQVIKRIKTKGWRILEVHAVV